MSPPESSAKKVGTTRSKKVTPDFLGASFPPAAGASAWGVNLKTPRYTLLREGPSPLEKLFISDVASDQYPVGKRHRKHQKGGGVPPQIPPTSTSADRSDERTKVSSRVSPGAPYYSTSFSVTPKITDVNVWTLHEADTSVFVPTSLPRADVAIGATLHVGDQHRFVNVTRPRPPSEAAPSALSASQATSSPQKLKSSDWSIPAPTVPSTSVVSLPPPPVPLAHDKTSTPFTSYVVQPYVLPLPQAVVYTETPRVDAGKDVTKTISMDPGWKASSQQGASEAKAQSPGGLRPTPFANRGKTGEKGVTSSSKLRRRIVKRSSVSSQSTSPLSSQRRTIQVRRRQQSASARSSKRQGPQLSTPPSSTTQRDTLSSAGSEVESILKTNRKGDKSSIHKRVQHSTDGGVPETRSVHFADASGSSAALRKVSGKKSFTGNPYHVSKDPLPNEIHTSPPTHVSRRVGCTGC